MLLRISQLADESGVPTSTLRYYERIGLVRPLGRSPSGYRLYDETAVQRLAFIGRAKRLGMSLADVATLIEAWFAGDCEPLHDRLRGFVRGRIGELRRQIADESNFEQQLQRILTRLDTTDSLPQRCRPDCGCDVDPGEPFATIEHCDNCDGRPASSCSLNQHDKSRRISDWQQLLSLAVRTERIGTLMRFVFDSADVPAVDLARMCTSETECCPFFDFTLEIAAAAVVLTVDGAAGAAEMFESFRTTTNSTLEAVGASRGHTT
jgi:DNA-binding transcriptional MerR regulator